MKLKEGKSELHKYYFALTKEIFPQETIDEEVTLNVYGKHLYFDIYVPKRKILIELQGSQHVRFVKFFHGIKDNFLSQKKRDKIKVDWAQNNGYTLLAFDKKISKGKFMKEILKSM